MSDQLVLKDTHLGVVVGIKVAPGSSRTAIAGIHDGSLKVKVAAPPEKGKANKELTEFLAKTFDLNKSNVTVVAGRHSRDKQVTLEGLTESEFRQSLKTIASL